MNCQIEYTSCDYSLSFTFPGETVSIAAMFPGICHQESTMPTVSSTSGFIPHPQAQTGLLGNAAHGASSTLAADTAVDAAARPGRAVRAVAPGLSALSSRKQQRLAVKKLVGEIEKLQLEGVCSQPDSSASRVHRPQGPTCGTAYFSELEVSHARLVDYIDAGLSEEPPPLSFSRTTKNTLAITGGAITGVACVATMTAAVVASTGAAIGCTAVTLPIGAVAEVINLAKAWDWWHFDRCDIIPGNLLLAGALIPLDVVAAVIFNDGGYNCKRLHELTVTPIARIGQFWNGVDYGLRPRLTTAEIANQTESRAAEELQRHAGPTTVRDIASTSTVGPVSQVADTPARLIRRPHGVVASAAAGTTPSRHWRFLETGPGATAFNTFQARLAGTAEYNNVASRRSLVRRVDHLVETMHRSPSLRNLCFGIAISGTESCTDRIALALNDMEVALVNEKAATGLYSTNELFAAGLGQFKLKLLDDIAMAKIASLRAQNISPDEVEIRLAYPTELGSRLRLPGVVKSMQYRSIARVTAGEIRAAERTVKASFNRNAQVDYLAGWEPWRQSLERRQPVEYTEMRREIAKAREAISTKPDEMSEQEWLTALDQQAMSERVQSFELARKMTNRFLDANRRKVIHALTI